MAILALLLLLLVTPLIVAVVLLCKEHAKAGGIILGLYFALIVSFFVYGQLERRSAAGRIVRWIGGEYEMQQYANDLAEDTKNVLNPVELQQWAMTVLVQTETTNYPDGEFPRDKVALGIRNLQSEGFPFEMVMVDATNSVLPQNRTVWIVWGSGFGHWGIRVCSPSFSITNSYDDKYYVEWKPGVYFWGQTH
ncbi:MAG TPA: hypothetical protein VGJ73_08610 [Verrucomicrobiae bacterium]